MQTGSENELKFYGLDSQAIAILRDFGRSFESSLDGLVNRFYAHLAEFPELRAKIGTPERIGRLKESQKQHWRHLFEDGFSADYFERCLAIGRTHERIGLEPVWYIGAYSLAVAEMTAFAARQHLLSPAKRAQVVQAVTSAVFMDMHATLAAFGSVDDSRRIRDRLGRFATNLMDRTVEVAIGVNEGAITNAEMVSQLRAVDADAQAIAAATEETVYSAHEIDARAREAAGHVREARDTTEHGRTTVIRAVASIDNIAETVSVAARRVSDLS